MLRQLVGYLAIQIHCFCILDSVEEFFNNRGTLEQTPEVVVVVFLDAFIVKSVEKVVNSPLLAKKLRSTLAEVYGHIIEEWS